MKITRLTTIGALAGLLLAVPGYTASYALLVGIGKYSNMPDRNLDGPPNDARALGEAIVKHWGFPRGNVELILNEQATKAAVLAALDRLAAETAPGDFVFFFVSSHGTSGYDPHTNGFGMDVNTGALVPADVRRLPPARMLSQLIVGSADLRPRLKRLEQKAEVFAVFDACYSGESVRSIRRDPMRSKDLEIEALSSEPNLKDADYEAAYAPMRASAPLDDHYPYRNVVYLSASAKSQRAFDIPQQSADDEDPATVDGRAHGILTDALLRGLRGEADGNHDGSISYRELHQFVYRQVMARQTPQLRYPAGSPLADQPVFNVNRAPVPPPPPARSPIVRVKLEGAARQLAPRLQSLAKIQLADRGPDLVVASSGGEYRLFLAGGAQIGSYAAAAPDALIARIACEPDVRHLVDWKFDRQDFSVSLAVDPTDRDAYRVGERLRFAMAPERTSYLLVLNIDVSGHVTVVYPANAAQVRAIANGGRVSTAPSQVGPPVGTEYMKVFAFERKPEGFGNWVGQDFAPSSEKFRQMLSMLSASGAGRAEATLLIYSTER